MRQAGSGFIDNRSLKSKGLNDGCPLARTDVIDKSEKELQGLKDLPVPEDSRDKWGREREGKGGAAGRDKKFDDLTGNKINDNVKELPGGKTAVKHGSTSRDGDPSITIQDSNKVPEIKVRYPDTKAED